MFTIFITLVVSYVVMSLIEYAAHRWPMHCRPFVRQFPMFNSVFESHTLLHHGRFFRGGCQGDGDPASRFISISFEPALHAAAAAAFGVPFIVFGGLVAYVTFIAFVIAHALAWTVVHKAMHFPGAAPPWLLRSRLFWILEAHHCEHHRNPGCNFNALLLGADFLFGTWSLPKVGG